MKKWIVVLLALLLASTASSAFAQGEIKENNINPPRDTMHTLGDHPNSPIQIPVLMYHHFIEGSPPQGTEGEVISIDLFEKQLRYLQAVGFNSISLKELQSYLLYGTELPPNPFVITIDDGYRSNYTLAYPVLKKLNMKANINIVVSSRGKTPGKFPHFSWEEAQEMIDSGLIEIGSHTYDLHDHRIRPLPKETIEDYYFRIYDDLALSKSLMEKHLAMEKPFIFAFPFGMYNSVSQGAALDLGFTLQLSVQPGVVTHKSDLLALERINVRGDERPQQVLENIYYYMNINDGKEGTFHQQRVVPLRDLPSDSPYFATGLRAYAEGLIKGDGRGNVNLEREINHFEALAILFRREKINIQDFETIPLSFDGLSSFERDILKTAHHLDLFHELQNTSYYRSALTYGDFLQYISKLKPSISVLGLNHMSTSLTRGQFLGLLYQFTQE